MRRTEPSGSTIGRPKKAVKRRQHQLRLLPEEHRAFHREAKARGLAMTIWLRGLGRKAVGLDP